MRLPAQIKPWLSFEELAVWVREAPSKETYQKRLAVWLTHIGPFPAHQVADLLQVSRQAVWLWVGQYNKDGPEGLTRKGRGGRRWAYLDWASEQSVLRLFEERAARGEILTAKQILPETEELVGQKISLGYIYGLLQRHKWRKLGPRPHHVKADQEKQAEFKKNSPS